MSKNRLNNLLRSSPAECLIRFLAKHPYLSAFLVCLFVNFLDLGVPEHVPQRLLLITLLLVGTAFLLYGVVRCQKQFRTQITALLILGMSFWLKYCYVCYTPIDIRQHDVYTFGGGKGHSAYIEYLLNNCHLPDFDPRERWQFYHPPLHHIISAVWIGISENWFGVAYDPARESLQTLTLFYAMTIIITGYRILRVLKLNGLALHVPLILIAFHPAFILLSGSINNDVLSVAFMMGAALCTLRWYDAPTWTETIQLALCIGLGMMTKLSVGLLAMPVGFMMLRKTMSMLRRKKWEFLGKPAVFAGICAPLGLWFPIRNLIRFGVPLTYVQEMSSTSSQYLGDRSFWSRVTDFSSHQFQNVFEQFASLGDYNEFNPLTALLKNALFGEYIREKNFPEGSAVLGLTKVFFWLHVVLAAATFVCMGVMLLRKCVLRMESKLFFAIFWFTMMLSFYQLSAQYPFVCSMNSRYITPVIFIGALFWGAAMQQLKGKKAFAAVVLGKIMTALPVLFAAMTAVIYMRVLLPC